MDEIKKLYYSIQEVANILSLSNGTVRYYEEFFSLKIPRTGKKSRLMRERRYSVKEIDELKFICYLLKHEGYTLKGALNKYNETRNN